MKVERMPRSSGGSCNFCSRGVFTHSGITLLYPYAMVTVFCNEKGGGLKASICDDCLDELSAKSVMDRL